MVVAKAVPPRAAAAKAGLMAVAPLLVFLVGTGPAQRAIPRELGVETLPVKAKAGD